MTVFGARSVCHLDVTFATANRLVGRFEELGLLTGITGQKRSRAYSFEPYLALFDDRAHAADQLVTAGATETE